MNCYPVSQLPNVTILNKDNEQNTNFTNLLLWNSDGAAELTKNQQYRQNAYYLKTLYKM